MRKQWLTSGLEKQIFRDYVGDPSFLYTLRRDCLSFMQKMIKKEKSGLNTFVELSIATLEYLLTWTRSQKLMLSWWHLVKGLHKSIDQDLSYKQWILVDLNNLELTPYFMRKIVSKDTSWKELKSGNYFTEVTFIKDGTILHLIEQC